MKNIPHRKTKNVFQFKSFRERIAEIDIRRTTLYHISHENELLEGDQSNFHEAVQKWSVLNMSEEFQQFIIPIRSVVTLPQLLHKKVFIFEHLSDCLKNASNLSLQALLEILVALAKDLRAEFCSFFFQFFDQLIIILDSREPDNLEYTFLCLASLFKIMRGFLRKKLEQVFERLVLLLEDSRPLYVTNFAAECFGFLARDVLNKKELLHMISVAVGSNSNVTMGCGRLVFEIMRGTNGQFHSCAEQYWRLLLLEMIIEEPNEKTGFKPQCLFDILIQTVTDMLHCIEPDNMEPFWIIMNTALENHLAHNPISNETAFHYILQLIGLIVEHQHGKHLRNVSCIVGKLIKTISGTNTEEILSTVSKIASVMLLSKNVIITRLEVSRLTKNILTLGHRSRRVFEEFVLNVSDCEMFDVLVLPDCLKYMEKTFDSRSIQLLMQIIARKSNPCKSGIELNNWKPIQIQLKSNEAVMKIKQVIDGGQQVENRDEFIACIVLLPHLKDFEIDNKILHRLEEEVYRTLTTIETDMEDCYIPVLSVLIETLVHINYPEIHLYVETVKRLLPVINSRKKEPLINIVNMCLVQISYTESDLLNDELFNVVHAHLCEFLASEHSRTRLLVTHSFTLFRGASIFLNTGSETLFDVLYSIESVEPDIHNYRKHVMLLKKLEFNASLLQCIKKPEFRVDAMRTVISLLSINFNLLWKPASEVLQTYADGFSITDFWHVYKQQLNCTLNVVSDNSTLEVNEKMHKTNNQELQSDDYKKIDYVNYRIQLLNNLAKFNRIFEAKNRDIVESFFRFMDKEYRTKKTADKTNEDTSKALLKIIIAYLNIFSGVRNPGTIFKSQQLYETFMEFLCHRNSEVQRLALSCIFTYENPAFIPYKETLYRLNCNKSFKQEIAVFFTKSASEGNELRCIVQDEHRVEVIPMVMKILHTKMIQKTTSPELKKLIIRFIGNFRENEIKLFMNMSFACYEKCLMAHALETYTFIVTKNPKVESFSIHRLQALILLIDNIFDEFAAVKNESFVRYLLHIKFCMDTTLLQMEHSLVKHLKSQATLNMVKLFDHFDNYHWSEEEIQAVFSIYVWPQLNKLENDCIHSPTPLLKLFSIWSKSLRYFPLLVKSSEASYTPLEKVISLLSSGKASDIVCREICKMINNMLSLELTDNENSYELPTKNTLISAHKDMNKKRNPGCLLLSSYFVNILRYIQKVLKQNKSISKDLLNILSCVSECTREDILCDTLTDMLFPMTIQKSLHPNIDIETLREMHHVLLKMLKLVSRPEKHMRKIGLLLERVNDLVARKCILQMIDLLVEKCNDPQLARCASILHDMNAMDKRWLDQPDFNRRLNAFRKVDELTNEQDAIRVELTIWIVHQCFYYLKTDHDLAIRDRANQFLQTNVSQCIKMQSNSDQRESVQYLIERVVLPAIIRGVKDKNGSVKYESIQLIGQFSRQCADYHSVFADLHPFTNEKDREIDFFENMTHLQSHRHRRALKRFCKILKTLEKPPSIRTLVNFVLPIVSTYLCNDVYKKKAKLTEAAAKCVILIGRLQPWPGYKSLLKQYLNKMKHNIEYQKQLIKIVVGLLDNFNYDLLKANRDNSSSQILGINTISKESTTTYNNVNDDEDDVSSNKSEENEQSNSSNKAELIVEDILKELIPDLFSTINYKEMQDTIKINERKERYVREKRDMLKIPLAIAIVKLLQKLPGDILDQNLPKLFIKVISFLKSNLKQVRSTARETLKSMLVAVGPQYLKMVLDHLSAILKRGFQIQVLQAVVYSILDALKERLNASIVDDIMQLVLHMSISDIFGTSSDGKDLCFIGRTPEGKFSKKTFSILQILASNMSEKSTLDLIIPFKEIISKTNSRVTITKAQEALNKVADGLCSNPNITVESLLLLVYGITSKNIPNFVCEIPKTSKPVQKNSKHSDYHLIPKEPTRKSPANQNIVVSDTNPNYHVLIEMSLEIFNTLIKKNQILLVEYEKFLEPLIPFLIEAMNSSHVKIITLSVKCTSSLWSNKIEVPRIVESVEIIIDNLLNILQKYAASETGRMDENFHLVKNCFKAIVTLMKFVKYFTISTSQLKLLLLYVEQDIMYSDRQHMALTLLRSIIGRKLASEEMASIMKKIAELSIMHDNDKLRKILRPCERPSGS
ncbi:small subunit processome component 20 homolog isoform X2 [Wyeomyia smithii]|uniref:small subunit processome component 20 homolog isoform X2 n=1 Tax=Wyeomyia smithii TaxID=174621 RepID=UPI002467D002|nr:small subunit processome component 20 homolog isoform X2 [Wyeomyia smithii]